MSYLHRKITVTEEYALPDASDSGILKQISPNQRWKFISYYQYSDFMWYLRGCIDSILIGSMEVPNLVSVRFVAAGNSLSSMIRASYGNLAGDAILFSYGTYSENLIKLAVAINNETPTDTIDSDAANNIYNIATQLSTLQPNIWNLGTVQSVYGRWYDIIKQRMYATKEKNWELISAVDEDLRAKSNEIADIIASGTI